MKKRVSKLITMESDKSKLVNIQYMLFNLITGHSYNTSSYGKGYYLEVLHMLYN